MRGSDDARGSSRIACGGTALRCAGCAAAAAHMSATSNRVRALPDAPAPGSVSLAQTCCTFWRAAIQRKVTGPTFSPTHEPDAVCRNALRPRIGHFHPLDFRRPSALLGVPRTIIRAPSPQSSPIRERGSRADRALVPLAARRVRSRVTSGRRSRDMTTHTIGTESREVGARRLVARILWSARKTRPCSDADALSQRPPYRCAGAREGPRGVRRRRCRSCARRRVGGARQRGVVLIGDVADRRTVRACHRSREQLGASTARLQRRYRAGAGSKHQRRDVGPHLAINLRSHFLLSRAALPHLPDGGSVVLISSVAGSCR